MYFFIFICKSAVKSDTIREMKKEGAYYGEAGAATEVYCRD